MKVHVLVPVECWDSYKSEVLSTWFVADEPSLTLHKAGVSDSDFQNLAGYYLVERHPDDYACATFESPEFEDLHEVTELLPSGGFFNPCESRELFEVPDEITCDWVCIM